MDPCSPLTKFSTCLNMHLLLKHRRGLPIGHGLWTGVQRRIATIEDRSFERVVVEYLLRILQRGEPHPQVLKVYPRSYSYLPTAPGTEALSLHDAQQSSAPVS